MFAGKRRAKGNREEESGRGDMDRGRRGNKEELKDCTPSLPEDKRTKKQQRKRDGKERSFFFFFYISHLLLPRKKVVYRTMVIYCQMANHQQKKNKNIPVIPPQNKENRQIHRNTMVIYFWDKTSAISLLLTIF